MAQVSTDDDKAVVIHWYVESGRSSQGSVDVVYDYRFPGGNGKGVSGSVRLGNRKAPGRDGWKTISVTEESALINLKANLEEQGYSVQLEKGHYKQVWVPAEE